MLNTVVGRELKQFADQLEGSEDFNTELHALIVKTIKDHERILFNGNGYDDAWIEEAEKRGLCNLKTTPDCLPYFLSDKNVTLFTESNVLTKAEMESRYEITLEGYCKVISIEACTMLDMAKKDILPAATAYAKELADTAVAKKSFLPDCQCGYEEDIVAKISALTSKLYAAVKVLEDNLAKTAGIVDITELSMYYKDAILPAMDAIREPADELETLTSKKYWPFPTYGDLLFGVR